MPNNNGKIMVLCCHPGVLLNYGILLSRLQRYNVSLCSSVEEALCSLKNIGAADFLIFDEFRFSKENRKDIFRLNAEGKIKRFLFVENLFPCTRASVNSWASSNKIPLQHMVRNPISLLELKACLNLTSYNK